MPAKARPKKNLSVMKRARQAEKRNLRNTGVISSIRTVIKKTEAAVSSGNREEAGKALLAAIKALNQAVSKGVIHKNMASRNISRLAKKINALPSAGAA